jgi:hypothetical protein
VIEGQMDDPVGGLSARAQTFQVVEIASVDLCSRSLYGVRREIGPGKAEHLVTCGDELRNDG